MPDGTNDPLIVAAMLRGSLFIDRYEPKFSGTRTGGYNQERAWPRTGAVTYYGQEIPSDVVPQPIINASYEAAFLELINPGSLSVVTGNSIVKKEKVGEVEVEYAVSSGTLSADVVAAATPVVTIFDGLLWQFFRQIVPWALVV
ncbi:DnaT-like ssDNA-binding protein [Phyllobacterium sp. 22552]|uniref:DnaT-like ssDNA-binding protein n=1 Tax=Phyllobacterium sp. 22552 TaxID=3453941 RepID=UPI003F855154